MGISGSLTPLPALGPFFPLLDCHVQLQYEGFCFILFYFVMSSCYLLWIQRGRKGEEELGGVEGGQTNQDVLYEKRIYFLYQHA